MEAGPRFERDLSIETRPELGELRNGFNNIVKHGSFEELVELLEKHPQRNSKGELVWLLTSGMAVEIVTGYEREHHDLDVVVMDSRNYWRWELLGTDNVTPGQYWADMRFDENYLDETSIKVKFDYRGQIHEVEMVHPVLIMTQKLSNAFDRPPREKDVADAVAVLKLWESHEGKSAAAINIVHETINALPNFSPGDDVDLRKLTEGRIERIVPQVAPIRKPR